MGVEGGKGWQLKVKNRVGGVKCKQTILYLRKRAYSQFICPSLSVNMWAKEGREQIQI